MSIVTKARECILGSVDLDALLEHLDPDWKDRFRCMEDGNVYYASERAFAFYTEDMPLDELRAAIKEAGA